MPKKSKSAVLMDSSTPKKAPKKRKLCAPPKTVAVKSEAAEQTDEAMPRSIEDHNLFSIPDLGQRQLAALNSGYMTDVMIRVGDEVFKCHSNILSFASRKLATVLKEKKPRLPDVDPRLFRLLLQVVYGGSTSEPQDVATLLQLGRTAYELQVNAVAVFCAKSLVDKVDAKTLWDVLDFEDLVHDDKLKASCFEGIRDYAGSFLTTDGFLSCTPSTIVSILKQDTLYNVTELQLFQACLRWANASEDEMGCRREALCSMLKLIRFRLFFAKEFTRHVSTTGLLSTEVERNIMHSCSTGENFIPNGYSESTDVRDPRHTMVVHFSNSYDCEHFDYLPSNGKNSFSIKINRDVFIRAVKMLTFRPNSIDYPYEEEVHVCLRQEMPGIVIHKASFRGEVMDGEIVTIKFDRLVPLFHNCQYTLQFDYAQKYERDNAYHEYKAHTIESISGLKFEVLNDFVGPPVLHVIVTDKQPSYVGLP